MPTGSLKTWPSSSIRRKRSRRDPRGGNDGRRFPLFMHACGTIAFSVGGRLLPMEVAATLLLIAGVWWIVLILAVAPSWQRRHRTPEATRAKESKANEGRLRLPTLLDTIEF